MYQALYRKWRPTVFEDVLGQEHVTATLKNQIINNKLSHAYLFSGTRGTGKTSTAKILSRAVNCANPQTGNPCNQCPACKGSLNGRTVDIIEIDAASNNKVDDVRIIRDEVVYTPAELKYKVYIIDEAHMLTNSAFNALLKTLEEPPSHVLFIFATTEPHKFPPTILSRCQRFDFKRITPFDTEKRIKQIISKDSYTISEDAISLLCRIADGSMRDALSILDQCLSAGKTNIEFSDISEVTGASDPAFIYSFAEKLINYDLSGSFSDIKTAYENGRDIERILDDLIFHFRNILIVKTLNDEKPALEILGVSSAQYKIYNSQGERLSVERVLRYIDVLSEAVVSKKNALSPQLCAEIAIAGMLRKPDTANPQGMLERLMELDNKVNKLLKTGVSNAYVKDEIKEVSAEVKEDIEISNEPAPVSEDYEEFVPDFNIPESFDYSVPESVAEEIVEELSAPPDAKIPEGNIPWDDILVTASKKADFGFKRIVNSAFVSFSEGSITITYDNQSYLSIAKMNKYDEIIKEAASAITGCDYSVRLLSGIAEEKKSDSNYQYLVKKLESYSESMENINFFD